MCIDLQVLTADPHRADTSRPHTTRLRCNNRGGERSGATGGGGGEGGDEWGREGGGVKRSSMPPPMKDIVRRKAFAICPAQRKKFCIRGRAG